MSVPKKKLHELIDKLPDKEIPTVKKFIEFVLQNPDEHILKTFNDAPYDDEPLEEDDLKAIQEAEKAISNGETKSLEQFKSELNL